MGGLRRGFGSPSPIVTAPSWRLLVAFVIAIVCSSLAMAGAAGTETTDADVLCAWYNSAPASGQAKLTNWCGAKSGGSYVNGPCTGASQWPAVSCTSGRVTKIQTYLSIAGEIGGSLPSTLGNLDALTYLNLYTSGITGTLPSLSGLTALETLTLTYNRVSGTLPSVSGLYALRSLRLDYNQMSGPITDSVCSLPSLSDFQVNYQTGSGFTCFPRCLLTSQYFNKDASLAAVCPTLVPTSTPVFTPSAQSTITAGDSSEEVIGGAVGGVLGGVLLLAIASYLWIKTKNRSNNLSYAPTAQSSEQKLEQELAGVGTWNDAEVDQESLPSVPAFVGSADITASAPALPQKPVEFRIP